MKLYPNINKAKTKLNWKPKISFENGLKKTINYYHKLSHGKKNSSLEGPHGTPKMTYIYMLGCYLRYVF